MKTVTRFAIVAMFLCLALGGASAQSISGGGFSRDDWLADYSYLKLQLERDYSHLVWFGSPQGGVDLPALDRATCTALERASSNAEASAAITAFVAAFHDGHFAPTLPPKSSPPASAEPPIVERAVDAHYRVRRLRLRPYYSSCLFIAFRVALVGFELVSDGFH
jgi:hypothetical protein